MYMPYSQIKNHYYLFVYYKKYKPVRLPALLIRVTLSASKEVMLLLISQYNGKA